MSLWPDCSSWHFFLLIWPFPLWLIFSTARTAEAEAQRIAQLAKIEEERIQAERAIAAAQLAGEEVGFCL